MPRCATFSYEEMTKEIAKVVKDADETNNYQALVQTLNA